MAQLVTGNFSGAIKRLYERRLMIRALPRLVHGRWGRVNNIQGYGDVEFRRYESLPLISTALDEGVTPDEETAPTMTTLIVSTQMYGAWMAYTDKIELVQYDQIVSEVSSLFGEQVGLSFDTMIRDALTDGATKAYAGAATQRTDIDKTNDLLTYADWLDGLATLQAANARPLEGERFVCIIGPYSFATLMQDETFISLFVREPSSPLRTGIMGSILNCDIYVTSNARSYSGGGASCTPYDMLFLGQDFYGLAGFTGMTPDYNAGFGSGEYDNMTGQSINPVQIIQKALGETGFDPLNQRGTIGWKASHEEVILNSAFAVSLEHATVNS